VPEGPPAAAEATTTSVEQMTNDASLRRFT
jgi:hypothetical protein